MRKTPILEFESARVTLCCGTRAALYLESKLPRGDCAAVRHAKALCEAFFAHASERYLPVAARELEALVAAGRGYAFRPHRLQFAARITPVGKGLCMRLSLVYVAGDEVRMSQCAESFWTADGAYRFRRLPKNKEKTEK